MSSPSTPPVRTDTKTKVCVVMPAYNAERTLERTLADLPAG